MDLQRVRQFIEDLLSDDQSGHAMDHIDRVLKHAEAILPTEPSADTAVTLAIVLLHESFDDKLDRTVDNQAVIDLLSYAGFEREDTENILHSIHNLSYSKNLKVKHRLSIEGQIAQDADRLDALGALGVARTFYYGGAKGHALYSHSDPKISQDAEDYRADQNCRNHFYDKLLRLKDLMNTDEGRRLAQGKHDFMAAFLREFETEIGIETYGKQ